MNEDFGAHSDILVTLARQLVGSALKAMEQAPPAGVTRADIASYRRRQEAVLVADIAEMFEPYRRKITARLAQKGMLPAGRTAAPAAPAAPVGKVPVPEAWTDRERMQANIAAMKLLARGGPYTAADVEAIRGYSGWGGLSLEKARPLMPEGVPLPKTEALIHEYYTPTLLYRKLAEALRAQGLIPAPGDGDVVLRALEPSAGIGRAPQGFDPVAPDIDWTLVEPSGVSSALLRAIRPKATVFEGYFEKWVAANPAQRFDLVVSNPPYGARGGSAELDPAPGYATKRAYLYFMFRALDLLRPGGIAAYVVPTGWLTGTGAEMTNARERVLRRHHLLGAFRLPSVPPEGGTRVDVVYDNFVVDLLLFQSRGGTLPQVEASDLEILGGGYFKAHPEHMLGTPEGMDNGWEPGQPKPRRGFQLRGKFTGLPADWTPRPMLGEPEEDGLPRTSAPRDRGGIVREDVVLAGLPPHVETAVAIGKRLDQYLTLLAGRDERVRQLHPELVADLKDWREAHGDPAKDKVLVEAAERRSVGAQRFLAAFSRGQLLASITEAPDVEPVYQGDLTVPGIAAWLFRQQGSLTRADLCDWWERKAGSDFDCDAAVADLTARGWCIDGDGWDELVPGDVYLTGALWPRLDRAKARAAGDNQAKAQAERLAATIGWRSGPDIVKECKPIDSWLPLDLVSRWAQDVIPRFPAAPLVRANGLLTFKGVDGPIPNAVWVNTDKDRTQGFDRDVLCFLGWANFDKGLWNPERETRRNPETGEEQKIPIGELREAQAKRWTEAWHKWLDEDARMAELEGAYNRALRGYVVPTYDESPLPLARWRHRRGFSLKPHQNGAVRKFLDNGSLLLGFDVGVGKTYAGVGAILAARQEGRCRRPVVLVPNTLTWKWFRDFADSAPDLRVMVIGSERQKVVGRYGDGTVGLRVNAKTWLAQRENARRRAAVAVVKALAAQSGRQPVAALVEQLGGGALAQLRRLEADGVVDHKPAKVVWKAVPDTPEARASKWTSFQAGGADVVILTYSALARTQISEDFVQRYVEKTIALRRAIELTLEKADLTAEARADGKPRKVSERNEAVMEQRVRGWVGEVLAPPKRWAYDPGIDWHQIGVDMLVVDEAQNFKNLFTSAQETSGEREATKRAWALDFRCASVREHTGGSGILLLSATPAKNAAVEFYTMVHLIQPNAWEQVGIDNPEAFIGRFGRFKTCEVMDPSGQKTKKVDVLTGFQNTDELRTVLDRWAIFKTAEEVGLKLPEVRLPSPHMVRVTPAQSGSLGGLYAELADMEEKIKDAAKMGLKEKDPAAFRAILLKKTSIAQRIYLTYLHPDLPGLTASGKPSTAFDPHDGPKLVECAKTIVQGSARACLSHGEGEEFCLGCAHIVFCDNVAVHSWMKRLLVEMGVPAARIAILNADEVPDTEQRQQIAEKFNGVGVPGDEFYEAPSLDVIIANAVAYEGMDLQRRTCAVHHLDVPWEPATLQQRNGRAVRQGNLFAEIEIHYYFVEGSNEPWRVQRIERKRGWMAEIVAGQRRSTNTTGESDGCTAIGEEERDDDLIHARPEDRERIRQARAEARERARRERIVDGQRAANKVLAEVVDNLARGRRLKHGSGDEQERGEQLQREAREALSQLLRDVPEGLYPPALRWREQAGRLLEPAVADSPLYRVAFVPDRGPVLFPGDRFVYQGTTPTEVGQVVRGDDGDPAVGMLQRWVSSTKAKDLNLVSATYGIEDDDPAFAWLAAEDAPLVPGNLGEMARSIGRWRSPTTPWKLLGPATQERLWPALLEQIPEKVETSAYTLPAIPVEVDGRLEVLTEGAPNNASYRSEVQIRLPEGAAWIPPTASGWIRFQALIPSATDAKGKPMKVTAVRDAARYWWGWELPRSVRPAGADEQ